MVGRFFYASPSIRLITPKPALTEHISKALVNRTNAFRLRKLKAVTFQQHFDNSDITSIFER
jgi:hypothetical protein